MTRIASAMPRVHTVVDSPLGPLYAAASDGSLVGLYFSGERTPPDPGLLGPEGADAVLAAARLQLQEYFAGQRRFFDLPIAARGKPFQLAVWQALRSIPYATTVSYGEIARRIGSPTASRAVGLANGQNQIPIIVPCHRVIGADGSLTGYGGGIERKRFLLDLERRVAGVTMC